VAVGEGPENVFPHRSPGEDDPYCEMQRIDDAVARRWLFKLVGNMRGTCLTIEPFCLNPCLRQDTARSPFRLSKDFSRS
jgi:hypothetical protein